MHDILQGAFLSVEKGLIPMAKDARISGPAKGASTPSESHKKNDAIWRRAEGLPHIDRKPWVAWIGSALVLFAIIFVVRAFIVAPKMDWATFGEYFFNPAILQGLLMTLQLTLAGIVLATIVGFVLAMMSSSKSPLIRLWSSLYAWVFRGIPLMVQLLLWYNLAIVFPVIQMPFVEVSTNTLISAFTASLLGLALHEAAYMAEVIRGGLLSVPKSQTEAGLSLGFTPGQVSSRIVFPQALRVIIPPAGNQFINLMKASSIVSVIGGGELLTRAQYIYGQNFAVFPLLLVASAWYLILTSAATLLQQAAERKLDPDYHKENRVSKNSARLLANIGGE